MNDLNAEMSRMKKVFAVVALSLPALANAALRLSASSFSAQAVGYDLLAHLDSILSMSFLAVGLGATAIRKAPMPALYGAACAWFFYFGPTVMSWLFLPLAQK